MAIRTYNFTFDTKRSIMPEPVFIRQNDSTGATLINVHLVDNGVPVTINGELEFRAMTADSQNVIADTTGFSNIDIDKGAFSYALPNQLSMTPGKIRIAYFMIVDASGNASTLSFVIFVKPAADLTPSGAKNYISIIDGLIKVFNEWNETAQSSWKDFVDANKEIIESIDPGGALLTEVIKTRHEIKNSSWIYNNTNPLSAHRGAHIDAPENTAMAVAHAGMYGYGLIECDPRLTSDNQVVIMHDDTVDRMTNGTGNVSGFTLDQLKQMTVDAAFSGKNDYNTIRVPTLAEILHVVNQYGMGINIDGGKLNWKDDNVINTVVGLIKQAGLMGRSMFSIIDPVARKRLNTLYPDATLTWGVYNNIDDYIAEAKTYTSAVISTTYHNLSRDYSAIAASGLPLQVWGVNSTSQYYDSIQHGARFVETDSLLPMTVTTA